MGDFGGEPLKGWVLGELGERAWLGRISGKCGRESTPMITFNALLREQGIDPSAVKLVRHQDTRAGGRSTPYEVWRAGDGGLELYQSIQKRPVLDGVPYVASFVGTPLNETLFVGLYEVETRKRAPRGIVDPVSGRVCTGLHFYPMWLSDRLKDCAGRLLIEWGSGYRAWVQRAHQQNKRVLELRREAIDPPFPGFLKFRERLSLLSGVPQSWRQVLSAVSGVYLLTCVRTGARYVGSADGETGFWGRWEAYVVSGHGGNRRMIEVPKSDYQVTILEVASSSTERDELIAMENLWKAKLLTREFGLNGN